MVSPPKKQSRFLSNIAITREVLAPFIFTLGLSCLFVTFFNLKIPSLHLWQYLTDPNPGSKGLPSGKLSTFIGPFKVTQDSASMSSCARVSVSVSKLVHKIQRNAHTYIFRDYRLWLLRHVIWILFFLWNFSYRPCSDYWSRNPPRLQKNMDRYTTDTSFHWNTIAGYGIWPPLRVYITNIHEPKSSGHLWKKHWHYLCLFSVKGFS